MDTTLLFKTQGLLCHLLNRLTVAHTTLGLSDHSTFKQPPLFSHTDPLQLLKKPELPATGSLHSLFAEAKMMLLGSAKLTSLPPTGFSQIRPFSVAQLTLYLSHRLPERPSLLPLCFSFHTTILPLLLERASETSPQYENSTPTL